MQKKTKAFNINNMLPVGNYRKLTNKDDLF